MADQPYDRASQDVGNVVALEHVNVTVPDQDLAALFYVSGLGLTRDPYIDFAGRNMWVNAGSQQFHLPRGEAQVLRGTIGLVVPDLDQLAARLARFERRAGEALDGSAYSCAEAEDGTLSITCPWGNRLRAHAASEAFGGMGLGLPYVTFDVAPGAAAAVARFYAEVLGAPACVVAGGDGLPCAEVRVGRAQRLHFQETAAEPAPYDGHHIAVYLANFSRPYGALRDRGLVTLETNEHEYRFQDIVDLDGGGAVATVEHEVRSLFHPLFGRELVNRDPAQDLRAYRAGQDAYVGLTHAGHG